MAMPLTVSPGATRAFEKWVEANAGKTAEEESTEVAMGKECVRNGCSNTYTGPASLEAVCSHHPGQAVFHETYKYWSCCERNKKYDFDEFRAIPGCRDGPETCAFSEASAGMAKKAPCRHDFFQVGPNLTLNIYAKKVCEFAIMAKFPPKNRDIAALCFLHCTLCLHFLFHRWTLRSRRSS